jgi:hypothetical protein
MRQTGTVPWAANLRVDGIPQLRRAEAVRSGPTLAFSPEAVKTERTERELRSHWARMSTALTEDCDQLVIGTGHEAVHKAPHGAVARLQAQLSDLMDAAHTTNLAV